MLQNQIGLIMAEEQVENELSIWLSTYGLITAERILERFQIHLHHEDLLSAIKNPKSFYLVGKFIN